MRIGILTQPLGQNYGGILQNFALQIVLKRMGHDPITLRVGKQSVLRWLFSCCKSIIRLLACKGWAVYKSPMHMNYRLSGMERFIKKHMNVTPTCFWYSARLVRKNNIELLLVGSDQTWRPLYNRCIEDLFGNFIADYPLPRVTYAASFGTSKWEYTDKQTRRCSELIKQFRAVSVREYSGVDLCRDHLGYDCAQWVLDPTLLLCRKDYEGLCTGEPRREPMLFAYILDLSPEKQAFCEHLARRMNLPLHLVTAHASITPTDCPERWVAAFRDAAFVLTDSFHGTAFSLIFHVPFFAFYNATRGNARFDSLIRQFGIASRVLTDFKSLPTSIPPMDWESIDNQRNAYRKTSLNFLQTNLH